MTLRNSVFPVSRAGLSCKFPFLTPLQKAECQWNCTRPCNRQNMQGRCLFADCSVSVAQGERCLERGSPYRPGRVMVATSSAALTPHVAASRGPTPPTSGYPSVQTWLCGKYISLWPLTVIKALLTWRPFHPPEGVVGRPGTRTPGEGEGI